MSEQKRAAASIPEKNNEFELDLKNAFVSILKKWRVLIVIALIGALIGAAVGYVSTINRYDPTKPGNEQDLYAIEDLSYSFKEYQEYMTLAGRDYMFCFKPDTKYCHGHAVYYLRAGSKQDTELVSRLLNLRNSNDYLYALQEITGFEGDVTTLEEVLSFGVEMQGKSDSTVIYSEGAERDDPNYAMITYDVTYLTEEQAQKALDYIDAQLLERKAKYEQTYGPIVLEKMSGYTRMYRRDVFQERERELNHQLLSRMTDITEKMNTILENKHNLYVHPDLLLNYFQQNYLPEGYAKQVTIMDKVKDMVKWAVVIGVVAGVLAVFVLLMVYIMGTTIHTAGGFAHMYGLNVIGTLRTGKPKKGLDKLIRRWFEKEQDVSSVAFMADSLQLYTSDKICLCETMSTDNTRKLASEIASACSKPVVSGALNQDTTLLETACAVGEVFLMVTLNQTKYTEIDAILSICRLHSLQVSGVVLVDAE